MSSPDRSPGEPTPERQQTPAQASNKFYRSRSFVALYATGLVCGGIGLVATAHLNVPLIMVFGLGTLSAARGLIMSAGKK